MTARGTLPFTAAGYALIIVAGLIIVWQGIRARHGHHDGAHALTAGIGLLPCPLTISVLSFAWLQGSGLAIGLVLASLAAGIGFTIATVAVLAIVARRTLGHGLGHWLPGFERGARFLQTCAGMLIVVIGAWVLSSAA